MALDDRDRTFEKALARHLRPSGSSSPDATSLAGAPAQSSAQLCPDPEMLAAYHDGALSSEERHLWKQHVLGCDRCQFVLSYIETPLDIPVRLETGKNVEVWQPLAPAGGALSTARIPRPSPLHTLRWLWLVPAGAIAATLVAWVSLQEKKPARVALSSPVEVAESRPAPAIAPLAKSAPAAPIENRERKESDERHVPSVGGVNGAGAVDRDLASKQLQNEVQLTRQAPSQYAANPAHGPSFTAQKQEQQIGRIAAGSAGAFDQKKRLDAPANAGAIGGRSVGGLVQQVPIPPPPPQAPPVRSSEPSFLDDGSLSARLKDQERSAPAPTPASNSAAPKAKAMSVDAISAATESVEVSSALQSASALEGATLRAAALQNAHVFWAPGGKQAWRIGIAGLLEHSKNKGLNWTPQISGVYTDLIDGSAPSAKVCWIVGTSGTILRTDDGGTHWIKLDSPVTHDLAGVRATDATHAWIWFVPDVQTGLQKTYQTSDGGATWSLVSNP
jgi:hypothetical protein